MQVVDDPAPVDSAAGAREQQDRVARYAGLVFWFVLALGTASIASHTLVPGHTVESGGRAHEALHWVTLLPAALAWLVGRGRTRSALVVSTVDAALTISSGVFFAFLGFAATTSLSVSFSVVLALTYTLVGRSIIVPSSFRRSLVIGSAAAIPAGLLFAFQDAPAVFGASPKSAAIFRAFSLMWCGLAVLASAANSHQLFGLRARIREFGKLGQYTLQEKLGEGGMGVVYRATHAMLRRPAAIKLLSKERTSEKDQARFEHEVQLTSRLGHPNTVSIFDYGRTADGVFYYVMEYVDGLDLEQLVEAHGPLAPARAIHILAQASSALGEAHALSLVHRDIKPANILLGSRVDEPDVVKVVDFGLARALDKDGADSRAGMITGTPLYLAPEAITNPESADARADLYALGAVGYFLLCGRHVFEGKTVVEVLSRHMLEQPVPPSTHLPEPVAPDLEAVIMRCLAKDSAARPQSAAALLEALRGCKDAAHYDRRAALAWWREHGARPRTERAVPSSQATMAVDWHSRRDLAAPRLYAELGADLQRQSKQP